MQHGTSQLLYKSFINIYDDNIGSDRVIKYLRKLYYSNITRNMIFYEELNKVLIALKDAGIDAIILKGAALAEAVYEDVGLRHFSDVDILVHERDLQRAKDIVSGIGIVLEEFISPEAHNEEFGCDLHYIKNGNVLEIHWHIVRKTKDDKYICIRIDELWDRAIPVKIARVNALMLSPEDLLLHLCIHLPRHRYSRLIWFCDISETIKKCNIDWNHLIKIAKEYRTSAYTYYGLKFTKELLGCDVPAYVLKELEPFNFGRKVFDSIPNDLIPDRMNVLQINPLLKLLLIDGTLDRFRFIREYFFPNAGVLSRTLFCFRNKNLFLLYSSPFFSGV